jgi:hypothetical protein
VNFDGWSKTAALSEVYMCVKKPTENNSMEFMIGPRVLERGANLIDTGLVRRRFLDNSPSFETSITFGRQFKFRFAYNACQVCGLAAGDQTLQDAAALTVSVDFSEVRFFSKSTTQMRLCEYSDSSPPRLVTDFSNVGVVVSDITILGSSVENTVTTGCVMKASEQTVSFAVVQAEVFETTTKLFFKRETVTCGATPTVSSIDSSGAVRMPFLSSSSSKSWSLDFDFSATSATSLDIFRLCVELESGTVLDFRPLGVRVTDIKVESGLNGFLRSNSVQPLFGQSLTINYAADAWFIDSSNIYLDCACTISDTCDDPAPVSGVTAVQEVSPNTAASFDFSSFSSFTANSATLCMRVGTPAIVHQLDCVTVGFDVSISPASVPANDFQNLRLTYPGVTLKPGDKVMFYHPSAPCLTANFATARQTNPSKYSSVANVELSGEALSFDFSGMYAFNQDFPAKLCVQTQSDSEPEIRPRFVLDASTVIVTQPVALAVGIAGDPHVRTATGTWLDFYGEAGVYQVLDGDIQVNAKFGHAVRDNFMIWHPKVMRPGTLVLEVGIKLKGTETSIRLGVQGGGIVSIRDELKSTDFWAGADERVMQVNDYSIIWSECKDHCEVAMPWGVHQRTKTLTVEGRGEFMQMHVTQSGGYRFIDIEAIPGSGSTGLLADAATDPDALVLRLLSGGEATYSAIAAMRKA